MKKSLIIIGIIVVIILGILIGNVCMKKSTKLSKDQFIALMKKFNENTNFKIENKDLTICKKDGFILSKRIDGVYTWTDTASKQSISYMPEGKTYSNVDYIENDLAELDNMNYEFCGFERYNDIKCAVGNFETSEYSIKIWVDAKTGAYLKIINKGKDSRGKSI